MTMSHPTLTLLQGGRSVPPTAASWSPRARAVYVVRGALRTLGWIALIVLVFGFLPAALRDLVRALP